MGGGLGSNCSKLLKPFLGKGRGKAKKGHVRSPSFREKMEEEDNSEAIEEMKQRMQVLYEENVKTRRRMRQMLKEAALADAAEREEKKEATEREVEEMKERLYAQEALIGTLCATIVAFSTMREPNEIGSLLDAPPSRTRKQIPITVVESYEELPQAIRDKLTNDAHLDEADMKEHLQELLYSLHFCHREEWYMTPSMKHHYDLRKASELSPVTFGRIARSLEFFKYVGMANKPPKQLYKRIKSEGKGGFGSVDFMKVKKTGKQVAVKKMRIDSFKKIRDCVTEASFLHWCNHENIVKFHNFHVIEEDSSAWVVMEYLSGGNVKEAVECTELQEVHIAFIMQQVLLALDYLHARHIVHRDLKAANVMLTREGDVKVVDLGLCIDLVEEMPASRSGSKNWMSPECIMDKKVDTPTDIWSLGMTMLEMATRQTPNRSHPARALYHISSGKLCCNPDALLGDNNWSPEFKDFLTCCLKMDPVERPSAPSLLQHPFIQTVRNDSQEAITNLVQYCWASQTELF